MNVTLVVLCGKKAGMEIPVAIPKLLIGRGENCHIRPQSNLVSRKHCMISVEKGSVAVEDCGSANGTLVNGKIVLQRRTLHNSDRIQVGPLELEVRLATNNRSDNEAPIHKGSSAASCSNSSVVGVDREVNIAKWLDENADEHEIHLPLEELATPQDNIPIAPAIQRPERQAVPRDKEIEVDGVDLLLMASVGILLVVIAAFVLPVAWATLGDWWLAVWKACRAVFNLRKWRWWVWSLLWGAALVWLLWRRAWRIR
jgi:hypothetical protein